MAIHELKCWPHAFDAICSGRKTFEVRSSRDRDFGEGDLLLLKRWEPSAGEYMAGTELVGDDAEDADTLRAHVTYILHGGQFGLPDGLCVMAIALE